MSTDGGLRSIITKNLWSVDWQPIESGATGGGIPDLNGCVGGADAWIECKQTSGWTPRFRTEQIGWIDRRYRAGGRVWIAVRRWPNGGLGAGGTIDDLWLVPGSLVRELSTEGLRNLPTSAVNIWRGGPTRWNWFEFAARVLGTVAVESMRKSRL